MFIHFFLISLLTLGLFFGMLVPCLQAHNSSPEKANFPSPLAPQETFDQTHHFTFDQDPQKQRQAIQHDEIIDFLTMNIQNVITSPPALPAQKK